MLIEMPRYRYMCEECTQTFTVLHGINEVLVKCQECNSPQSMRKLLSRPFAPKKATSAPQSKVGDLTKEYIEENRKVLEQQKKEAKKKTYDPA